jgi:hypothetical protein
MAKKNKKTVAGKQPDIRSKNGRFQLSAWKDKRIIEPKHEYDIERVLERVSICLSIGVKKNGEWENVQAWFERSQFGDLKATIDEFAEELRKLNGTCVDEGSGQQ